MLNNAPEVCSFPIIISLETGNFSSNLVA